MFILVRILYQTSETEHNDARIFSTFEKANQAVRDEWCWAGDPPLEWNVIKPGHWEINDEVNEAYEIFERELES